jgi:hypothetical protein
MKRTSIAAFGVAMLVQTLARAEAPASSSMAPLEQYLFSDRNAEVASAKSAAPKSISDNAEIMVLEKQGWVTAVKGTNGFVCMVERSWSAPSDDPDFWNPKLRAPICYNAPGARTVLPLVIAKTKLVLARKSKAQIFEAIGAALDKKELPALESGALGYMMSKDGMVSAQFGHWHPHLMFFVPLADAKAAGANLPSSPIVAMTDPEDHRTAILLVPVPRWSDGTADEGMH